MKKILVPVDMSAAAGDALDYAIAYANEIQGSIKVVHCFYPVTDASGAFVSAQLITDLEQIQKERLETFVQPWIEAGLTLETELVLGFPAEKIVELSKDPEIELLVMGNQGEHDLADRLFGSVSDYVTRHAYCPVWLVPKGGTWKTPANILYAANFESIDNSAMDTIISLARYFNSGLHFVHVSEKENQLATALEQEIYNKLALKKAEGLSFNLINLEKGDVADLIRAYAEANRIDLIVLITHHRNIWNSLVHKSVTKNLALSLPVPMLVLHREDH